MKDNRFISKSSILAEIKKNLEEMPMKFDGTQRPDPSIEKTLSDKDSPLSDNPALDVDVDKDGVPDTFEELLASERYQQVVDKFKEATGVQQDVGTGMGGVMQLMPLIGQSFQQVVQTESRYKSQLEDLAIELVVNEEGLTQFEPGVYGIKSHPEKQFRLEAKLVGMGQVKQDDFEQTPEEPTEETFEMEEQAFETFEDLKLERAKRRFINSIMQGSSKRGHYMYALVQRELRDLTGSDNLFNQYGVMMTANDMLYWQVPASMMLPGGAPGGGGAPVGGREEVDMETDPPTIKATAISFPILLHELIKGIKEYLGAYSMDDLDDSQAQKVMELEDTLDKEIWDLRLGPAIWDRFRASYPEEILMDDDKKFLQNALYAEFVTMDARTLLSLANEVMSGTNLGKETLQQLVDGIIERMKGEDAEEAMENFRNSMEDIEDNFDDDDLEDFLGGLGISLN
jgi:hypothetical protein